MRLAKRHPALRQVVGQVCGRDQRIARRRGEPLRTPRGAPQHRRRQRKPIVDQVDRFKIGSFVFLEVAVVAHRQALQRHQQRHQRAVHAAGLAAQQLSHVWIALLGHDARAGGQRLVQGDEAELDGRPQHQILGQPREMHGQAGQRGEMLNEKITIGDCIQTVAAHAREPQRARHILAVQRVWRTGQSAGAQRQDIGARVGVSQPTGVALQHLPIRQQVMPEQDRLRSLQVGVAGHDGCPVPLRRLDERRLHVENARHAFDECRAHEQAHVGGHLVISAARGVQSPGWLADLPRQLGLDQAVDVFVLAVEARRTREEVGEARDDCLRVGRRNHALPSEHARVGNAAEHVPLEQAAVNRQRRGVRQRSLVERFAEPSAPQGRAQKFVPSRFRRIVQRSGRISSAPPRRCSAPPDGGSPDCCPPRAARAPACAGPG